ncbi:MAG: class I SAM-dependent methyltransferase [Patescibacteria group bacterium]
MEKIKINKWSRIISFEPDGKQEEIWIYKDSKTEKRYNVEVTLGKPIDILSLKANIIKDLGLNADRIRDSRISLFEKDNLRLVDLCPICGSGAKDRPEVFNVYGATYVKCEECSHYFVKKRPTKNALEEFYSKDNQYQSTYTDKKTVETRVQQVAMPKAEWVIQNFEKIYGRKPKSILDVGAGSGHFVSACKNLGIMANGVELSQAGRDFCKENFGFELSNKDFIEEWKEFADYEVITFWGVIEHVPYPLKMLDAAAKVLSGKEGLVVAEVPRWDCFSTAVQRIFPNSITRHLDPLGHINCFTDSSLATTFKKSNFDIVAAWYFGMDIYEFITQISYLLGENKIIEKIGKYIPALQNRIDLAMLSDEIVMAATPTKKLER